MLKIILLAGTPMVVGVIIILAIYRHFSREEYMGKRKLLNSWLECSHCGITHRYYQQLVDRKNNTHHCPHCEKALPFDYSLDELFGYGSDIFVHYSFEEKELPYAPALSYKETMQWLEDAMKRKSANERTEVSAYERKEHENYKRLQKEKQQSVLHANIQRIDALQLKMADNERAVHALCYVKKNLRDFIQQPKHMIWTERESLLLEFESFSMEVFEGFFKYESYTRRMDNEVVHFAKDDTSLTDKVNGAVRQ